MRKLRPSLVRLKKFPRSASERERSRRPPLPSPAAGFGLVLLPSSGAVRLSATIPKYGQISSCLCFSASGTWTMQPEPKFVQRTSKPDIRVSMCTAFVSKCSSSSRQRCGHTPYSITQLSMQPRQKTWLQGVVLGLRITLLHTVHTR